MTIYQSGKPWSLSRDAAAAMLASNAAEWGEAEEEAGAGAGAEEMPNYSSEVSNG